MDRALRRVFPNIKLYKQIQFLPLSSIDAKGYLELNLELSPLLPSPEVDAGDESIRISIKVSRWWDMRCGPHIQRETCEKIIGDRQISPAGENEECLTVEIE